MRSITRRPLPALLLILAAGVAACGGGSAGTPPSTASTAPSGPVGDCKAAPAPPANQPGWNTASKAPTVFPVLVNSSGSLTCGSNRLLFTFLDSQNQPVGKPDRTASIAVYNLGRNGDTPTESQPGSFVWGIDNVRGFYVANVSFPEAGTWGAQFTTAVGGGTPETIRMTFEVATSSPVVRVGEKAPASDTPTAASVNGNLAAISTDASPDPAFYKTSVKEALAAHQPFVLVFATPKFCTSAQCGPTLDRIKPLAAKFPTVDFIHVEPYQLTYQNGGLQPVLDAQGNLQSIPAVTQWGLLSEPWVFVVDRTGTVTASFEGVVSIDEITAAADAVK
jgi:hypothetical protein